MVDQASGNAATGEKSPGWAQRLTRYSGPGVALACLFFALSLQPSVLPRGALFQGIVSGITMMIGYGLGTLGGWTWKYVDLPVPAPGTVLQKAIAWATGVTVVLLCLLAIWRPVGWQNDVRELMGMGPVETWVWLTIIPVTLAVAAIILLVSRGLRGVFRTFARWLSRVMSDRLAKVAGAIALVVLLLLLVNDVLINGAFSVANSAFSVRDSTTEEGDLQPQAPERSGSPDSTVAWDSLGRKGRTFVSSGPTVNELDEADASLRPLLAARDAEHNGSDPIGPRT